MRTVLTFFTCMLLVFKVCCNEHCPSDQGIKEVSAKVKEVSHCHQSKNQDDKKESDQKTKTNFNPCLCITQTQDPEFSNLSMSVYQVDFLKFTYAEKTYDSPIYKLLRPPIS